VKTSGTASALSRRELRKAGVDAARIDASYQRALRLERWARLVG
jgi:hypothetical protein